MLKLTRWTIAHRRIVVVSWIVLAVGVLGLSQAVGKRNANNFSLPNTDSQRAIDLVINTAVTMRSSARQVELGGQAIKQAQQASLGFATGVGLLAADGV